MTRVLTRPRWLGPLMIAATLVWPTLVSAQERPLPEAEHSTTGYATVDEAQTALKAKPGVEFSTVRGWLIATDESALTVWSFAPRGYPAYPAVVKRQVLEENGQVSIEMSVLCEAEKAECDDLVRTFAQMNGFELPR